MILVDGERETKRVTIACQSGGSHSDFSAGVLKRLLAEKLERYEIVALSGTSGGAICALLVWYALLSGDGRRPSGCWTPSRRVSPRTPPRSWL